MEKMQKYTTKKYIHLKVKKLINKMENQKLYSEMSEDLFTEYGRNEIQFSLLCFRYCASPVSILFSLPLALPLMHLLWELVLSTGPRCCTNMFLQ